MLVKQLLKLILTLTPYSVGNSSYQMNIFMPKQPRIAGISDQLPGEAIAALFSS